MLLSSYDTNTDDRNMTTHCAVIGCLGRDSPWFLLYQDSLLCGRKTWERSWDNRLPAYRTECSRIQSTPELHLALLLQSFITYSYLMYACVCMPYALFHTCWLFGSLFTFEEPEWFEGFLKLWQRHDSRIDTCNSVLCAQGPRKRTRSQSTEGSRAGCPFLA